MPRKKIHGVIDAVRYLPDGRIEFVRAFERRGAVWSDWILLNRAELVKRLERGGKYTTGKRREYHGSSMEIGEDILYKNQLVIISDPDSSNDQLTGVPVL